MRARKSLSTILLLAALGASSCKEDAANDRIKSSKYRKLNNQEIKRILIGNNIQKYPMFWSDDGGINIFEGGYAVKLGYGTASAVYMINDDQFCIFISGMEKKAV